jgi:hypothetical protein
MNAPSLIGQFLIALVDLPLPLLNAILEFEPGSVYVTPLSPCCSAYLIRVCASFSAPVLSKVARASSSMLSLFVMSQSPYAAMRNSNNGSHFTTPHC